MPVTPKSVRDTPKIPDSLMAASFSAHFAVPIFVGGKLVPGVGRVLWNDPSLARALRAAILDEHSPHAPRLLKLFREFAPFYTDIPLEERLDELLAFVAASAIQMLKLQVACVGFGRQASADDILRILFEQTKVCIRSDCRALFVARRRFKTCHNCRGRKPNPAAYMRKHRRRFAAQEFARVVRLAGRGQFKPSDDLAERFQQDPRFRTMIDQWAEESPDILAARRRLKRYLPKAEKAPTKK